MTQASAANADQAAYWNDAAGPTWAAFQTALDRQLADLGAAALRALAPRAGERVLDIGCGCGATTLDLAEAVGPQGEAVGVDVSEPMLAVARARAKGRARFLAADAQTADLGDGAYDAAFSRFGVMFFNDPPAAFANIRRALGRPGRLAFVCWRPLADNPWMSCAYEAAAHLFPARAPADPHAPGPFAFQDPDRVRGLLEAAGFQGVRIERFDADLDMGGLEECVAVNLRVGPLGSALREHPEQLATAQLLARAALEARLRDGVVRMPAGVFIVQASA